MLLPSSVHGLNACNTAFHHQPLTVNSRVLLLWHRQQARHDSTACAVLTPLADTPWRQHALLAAGTALWHVAIVTPVAPVPAANKARCQQSHTQPLCQLPTQHRGLAKGCPLLSAWCGKAGAGALAGALRRPPITRCLPFSHCWPVLLCLLRCLLRRRHLARKLSEQHKWRRIHRAHQHLHAEEQTAISTSSKPEHLPCTEQSA